MSKVSRSVPSRKRRKKVLQAASGYQSSRRYRIAHERVAKAMQYQYVHRRTLKRDMRSLWIVRISAALKQLGQKYSVFIANLNKLAKPLNRKMLAKVAMEDAKAFEIIVKQVNSEGDTE